MRSDMNKVVTEKTRYGGKGGRRKTYEKASLPREKRTYKGADVDLRPKREGIRKKHMVDNNEKYFSDLLGPLEKFLISRVGRRWDDVWSEICKVMKGNSLQAAHIKGHIKQMVGGIPHSGETFFRDKEWFTDTGDPVYVNESGILCKGTPRVWRRKEQIYHYYRESDTVEYHKLNGAWFRVEISSFKYEKEYKSRFSSHTWTRTETAYTVVDKRALSKKEIKKLRLNERTETVAPKLALEPEDG